MIGCVRALDGWLCKIETPSANETSKARSVHSGHYIVGGVNAQAYCDRQCGSIHVSIVAPGSTNDIVAFAISLLCEMVDNLPDGKYIVADNAHTNKDHLLTPYSGQKRATAAKDTFNFYCSQFRVGMEQSFGLLTYFWQVYKSLLWKKPV
jgi:DDE superfamily endonuclease